MLNDTLRGSHPFSTSCLIAVRRRAWDACCVWSIYRKHSTGAGAPAERRSFFQSGRSDQSGPAPSHPHACWTTRPERELFRSGRCCQGGRFFQSGRFFSSGRGGVKEGGREGRPGHTIEVQTQIFVLKVFFSERWDIIPAAKGFNS